jgi:DNA-binding NarL/FixJ family response regulator
MDSIVHIVIFDPDVQELAVLQEVLKAENGFEVIAACAAVAPAVLAIRTHQPAIVVASLDHPRETALLISRVMAKKCSIKFIFVCSDDFAELVKTNGTIIPRAYAKQRLPHYLRQALAGGALELSTSPPDGGAGTLTLREREVYSLLLQGHCNKEIAKRLDIVPGTVKLHVHNVLTKLSVTSRRDLLVMRPRS